MSQWETYKLSQICHFIDYRGKTPNKEDSGIPFITAKNVKKEGFSFEPREYISLKTYNTIMKRGFPREDDIFFTTEAPLGNVCKIPSMKGIFAVGQRIIVLQTDSKKISNEYLVYELKSKYFSENLRKCSSGSTVKGVRSAELSKIEVRIPPIAVQKKIAKTLDTAAALLKLRKQQLAELDQLIQSVFYEMFGDPVRNEKGWEICKLSKLGTLNRGMSKHRPRNDPKLLNGNYPLIQTGDVANADFVITEYTRTYSELGLKQSKMWNKGTLCITIAANIAKTAIMGFDACFPDSVVGFNANEKTNNIFIYCWFGFFQKILEDQAPESAQKNINLRILNDLDVIKPPISLQTQFAAIVQKIEQKKALVQQSIDETQTLFDSLMSRYFDH